MYLNFHKTLSLIPTQGSILSHDRYVSKMMSKAYTAIACAVLAPVCMHQSLC